MAVIFKLITRTHIFLYRLTGGRLGGRVMNVHLLLLTTIGRKTGKKRTNPLMYIRDGDAYIISASGDGTDKHPAWYLNLSANPQVNIQVMNTKMAALAETVPEAERAALWAQFIAIVPAFEKRIHQTNRVIPLVRLSPQLQPLSMQHDLR